MIQSRERNHFDRPARIYKITQYERDCAAIKSRDRFKMACSAFALSGGLGLIALLMWLYL